VLEGISREPFVTDSAFVNVGGLLGRRVELALSASFAAGHGVRDVVAVPEHRSVTGTVQFRYAISALAATFVNYSYYSYDLTRLDDLVPALPAAFDRNAVRVGFSLRLPLYGTGGQTGS
jgi:hypothetical protein